FVVVQVAGALALVVTAGLAVRSASALLRGPQGFDPDGLLTFSVSLSDRAYGEADEQRAFARDAEARLAAIPGVSNLAVASSPPRQQQLVDAPDRDRGRAAPAGDRASARGRNVRLPRLFRHAAAAPRGRPGLRGERRRDAAAGGHREPHHGRAVLAAAGGGGRP